MDDFGTELDDYSSEHLHQAWYALCAYIRDGLRWDGYTVDQFFPNP